ncbi:dynein light chain type 1-domain-containing protein [Xylaria curta]|nr:dynein light chain type 1-domain-containing protein [Xylaria curta]
MAEQASPPPAAREKLDGSWRIIDPSNVASVKRLRLTRTSLHAIAQIKSADMTEDMQQEAIDVAQEAMGKFTIEKDIAQHIKKTFDERKGPTWHCIVGRNFGSFVTHETKHFIYFYLGHCAILLFKTQ